MKRVIIFIAKYAYAFCSAIYLFAFGFIFSRNRDLILKICNHFGCKLFDPKCIIPSVKIAEIMDESALFKMNEMEAKDGNILISELICIISIIKKKNPKKVFEIGTFDGRTALNMAINSSEQTKVYTLDLPKDLLHSTKFPLAKGDRVYIKKIASGSRFSGKDCEKKIIQLYGDSGKYDFSPFFKSMGLVFIDGAHSYDYVLNDSAVALRLITDKQSIIIWHDYGVFEGVTKALNGLYLHGDRRFRDLKHIAGTSLAYLFSD